MIKLTRLDGAPIYLNEQNIQWIEILPDTVITFLGGARVIVREKVDAVIACLESGAASRQSHSPGLPPLTSELTSELTSKEQNEPIP